MDLFDSNSDPDLTTSPNFAIEEFLVTGQKLVKSVIAGRHSGQASLKASGISSMANDQGELRKVWWRERIRGAAPSIPFDPRRPELRIVDLCSGCGGLATGIKWACEAVGLRPIFELCVEVNSDALGVYRNNLKPLRYLNENLANLVSYPRQNSGKDRRFEAPPSLEHDQLVKLVGNVDLLIAGPPCEGNSNFNNRTRRTDTRNELYVAAVACAIALEAKAIIIENVATVRSARQDVVGRALDMLSAAGYWIGDSHGVLEATWFGTPQKRRRHFLIATRSSEICMKAAFEGLKSAPVSAMDAIGDLIGIESDRLIDQPAQLSEENTARVNYLISNDVFDLPDSERPVCHQDGNHSYRSVYGRMYPHEPAQTLTTGFLSPGRGRYTHPVEPRGLTIHEGARLQGFPDDFQFEGRRGEQLGKNPLAHLIGDAVPPQLGYAVGLATIAVS